VNRVLAVLLELHLRPGRCGGLAADSAALGLWWPSFVPAAQRPVPLRRLPPHHLACTQTCLLSQSQSRKYFLKKEGVRRALAVQCTGCTVQCSVREFRFYFIDFCKFPIFQLTLPILQSLNFLY
jgi:hypothetical protein